ncbi:DUF3179 domain-containing protein [Nitrococcus mobilis]|uniref:DUF3179 domain-containing protein n=1 Tax=Nitrococcus mobilis Nb-231 TaxID=314278 RepID=A4BMD4_9GAMM|nr:DUF3179 domain-containing protein [Nitrococcus mobilis]EAR23472.1 hypothetical protein NB231_16668 [Nitrococcus mobilis Nb-231]
MTWLQRVLRWSDRGLLCAVLMSSPGGGALATDGPPIRAVPLTQHAPLERYVDSSLSGGPPKDGIPAIDAPRFWNVRQADRHLGDGDVVFGVYHKGEAKAYPQRILVWHEIVNDVIGQTPVSITYCPLTGTALGFLRGATTLGVSGRLVNSNLIMYDRATDSWWPQVLATAIDGPLAGKSLRQIPVVWTTWKRWRARHPETRVLSTHTGYIRNYKRDPYGSYNPIGGYYRRTARRLFPVMSESERYAPKSVFLVARTETGAIAFRKDSLRERRVLHGETGGGRFTAVYDPELAAGRVFHNPKGVPVAANELTFGRSGIKWKEPSRALEPVASFDAMWFAYAAFYPNGTVVD